MRNEVVDESLNIRLEAVHRTRTLHQHRDSTQYLEIQTNQASADADPAECRTRVIGSYLMAISDLEVADAAVEKLASAAYRTLKEHEHKHHGNPGMGFRSGMNAAVPDLRAGLLALYAEVGGADDEPLKRTIVEKIDRRVSAFIQSCQAGQRGSHVAMAARTSAELLATSSMGTDRALEVAVHKYKKRNPPTAPAAPSRQKQDKFGILDSPRMYEADFALSVGLLGSAVIFFDLDDFKKLNTRFTEPVIDRTLLRELHLLIDALVRGRGFGYAEGGDEFVILLPNTNRELAEVFVTELLARIRAATFNVDGATVSVTASAGIALATDPTSGQRAREEASAAKRDAKEQKKDRYCVFGATAAEAGDQLTRGSADGSISS